MSVISDATMNIPKESDGEVRRILVMCTQNSVRSPMAEALLRAALGKGVDVQSVGVESVPVSAFSCEVMQEIGLDISGHESRTFDNLLDGRFDVIVALSSDSYEYAHRVSSDMGCEVEYWNVAAPPRTGEVSREVLLDSYRRIRDELRQHIYNRLSVKI